MRAIQIKAVRRDILDTLKMVYPGQLTFSDLCAVLPLIEADHLRKDVQYLIDKGYVDWIKFGANLAWAKRSFKLTPGGVETADKINTDPALEP